MMLRMVIKMINRRSTIMMMMMMNVMDQPYHPNYLVENQSICQLYLLIFSIKMINI
ncbi:hypothetical protein BLA29_014677 [Euroglyphus maynei]|uniref:Uncharacterized protein n=1 Tax=Euroglyphus maynei TaxID=6958 RepID=A0A1Y3BH53_EURMA|nr:hypothetical protein BLA29_014677 [Euroglyphus maynei]